MQSREIQIKLPSVTPVGKYEFNALRPWQTRTHCCGHIVADTMLPRLPTCATFVADTNFVQRRRR